MDYETVLEEQLEATELSELEAVYWKNFLWRIWCTASSMDSRSWTLIRSWKT